jgi:hypothetical protein
MDYQIVTPTPREKRRRSSSTTTTTKRVAADTGPTPPSGRPPVNLRTMTVRELEAYFGELAPLARYHCSRTYTETLSATVAELVNRNKKKKTTTRTRGAGKGIAISATDRHRINASLAAIYAFVRGYLARVPELKKTEAYEAYVHDAAMILADWKARTHNLLTQIATHPRTQADTLLFEGEICKIRRPSHAEWRRVHELTAAVFAHASQHAVGDELRALCASLLTIYCAAPCIAQWFAASNGVGAFRYHLQCLRGHALDAQWSTSTWSELGHAWHPELAQHTFLVLKDMAVPLPWRGLGFSRLLRDIERTLVVDFDRIRIHGLFLHHVHRDMLAVTLARGMHGYQFWAHPFPEGTPVERPGDDDNNFRRALCERASEDIQNGTNRSAKPWMYAVTETYGNDPEHGELFHLYWLTPMGARLAAARTMATRRVLVPLTVLQRPLAEFAQLACAFVRGFETRRETDWRSIPLTHASDSGARVRMRFSLPKQPLFADETQWSLCLSVIPHLNAFTDSLLDSPLYLTQVALFGECVKCLCDTMVYADVTPCAGGGVPAPPLIIQLRVAMSETCTREDTETLASDLHSFLGDRLMAAAEDTDDFDYAVFTIHNPQKRH